MTSTSINHASTVSIASMSLSALGDLLHQLQVNLESRTVNAADLRSQLHAVSHRLLQLSNPLTETEQENASASLSGSTADQSFPSVPVPYRLLIAGSRETTPGLLEWAAQAVKRAKAKNWAILVGDAAGVDSAVISACNTLGVPYVCFGISEQPRSTAFRSLSEGGTGRYVRYGASYAERDRRMVEVADRGLFLWNGTSKGTKAAFDYMQSRGTSADLLTTATTPPGAAARDHKDQTVSSASKQTNAPATVETAPPATIELLLDVGASGATSKALHGVYALRALDAGGNLLHQTRYELEEIPANAPDIARLHLLCLALDRLVRHLRRERAPYALRLVQSSKNVEGWLAHGWKRNVPAVKEQGAAIDKLLQRFQRPEWIRMPPAQLTSALAKIQA